MKKIALIAAVITAMFCATTVNAQKFGQTPEDSTACIMNNSLYQEFYKQQVFLSQHQ